MRGPVPGIWRGTGADAHPTVRSALNQGGGGDTDTAFLDPRTWTLSYVVDDGAHALVIDPVRDYDPNSARTA